MKHYEYKTKGVYSQKIEFDYDGKIVKNVKFTGGCNGNLKALSILVDGGSASEIVSKLSGISCGGRATSCADQLASAIQEVRDD